jgi:hypothetical protein
MTAKKALVEIGGTIQELPNGDSLVIAEGQFNKVSEAEPLIVDDVNSRNGSEPENAKAVYITGLPGSDFTGVDILGEIASGQISVQVTTPDLKKGADGGLLLSDAVEYEFTPRTIGTERTPFALIDTAGFNGVTITIHCSSAGGTNLQGAFSDYIEGVFRTNWFEPLAVAGQLSSAVPSESMGGASGTNTLFGSPAQGRYLKLWATSFNIGTKIKVVLRRNYASIGMQNVLLRPQSGQVTNVGCVSTFYPTVATLAGLTYKFTATASNNAATIKASTGRVVGYRFTNLSAAPKFVRLYNKASAPTMGTDSPQEVIAIPANTYVNHVQEGGIGFTTGIAFACTGAAADLDNTAITALDVIGSVYYT